MADDLAYWLAFSKIKGLGTVKIYSLWKYFGSLDLAWEAHIRDFREISVLSSDLVHQIKLSRPNLEPLALLERVKQNGANILSIVSEEYPLQLRKISQPPAVLYYRGNWNKEIFNRCLAIVGTRSPSEYGNLITRKFSEELAKRGVTIVSGLAAGVDAIAHQSAVNYGLTVAVLGSGIDRVYPVSNSRLYRQIIDKGLIISEYEPGLKPEGWRFPARNRIISGLSKGILVTEAALKSGSLITADFALEQGKDVFAIPGNINSKLSEGCHYLIKQGAQLVSSPLEILTNFNWQKESNELSSAINEGQDQVRLDLSYPEREVFLSLTDEPLHLDKIVAKLSLSLAEIRSNLIVLELKQLVSQLPGNLFVKS